MYEIEYHGNDERIIVLRNYMDRARKLIISTQKILETINDPEKQKRLNERLTDLENYEKTVESILRNFNDLELPGTVRELILRAEDLGL